MITFLVATKVAAIKTCLLGSALQTLATDQVIAYNPRVEVLTDFDTIFGNNYKFHWWKLLKSI